MSVEALQVKNKTKAKNEIEGTWKVNIEQASFFLQTKVYESSFITFKKDSFKLSFENESLKSFEYYLDKTHPISFIGDVRIVSDCNFIDSYKITGDSLLLFGPGEDHFN